jgi:hypothetical protein
MPRVKSVKHRVQRAFAPLLFRAIFQPERLLTPPPLPWLTTFPPHIDGHLPNNDPLPDSEGPSVRNTELVKMKKPNGEPGRSGERGFNLKSTLNLPGDMYEEVIVSLYYIFFLITSDLFHSKKFIASLQSTLTWLRPSRINRRMLSKSPTNR